MLPCDTSHTNLGNPITSKPSIRSTNSTAAAKLDKHKPICSNLIQQFNLTSDDARDFKHPLIEETTNEDLLRRVI